MNSFDITEIKSSIGEIKTSPSELFDDDDGRIAQKTGISNIHRSAKSAYDLALDATSKLSSLSDLKDNIDYIIYVTQSPSYFLPNHASRIQDKLGISKEAMCFDINQGCSGFVQALFLMNSLLKSNTNFGLIICSDTYSHHLSKEDRSTQVLFSDGATATMMQGGGSWKILDSNHLTDGSGADLLSKSIEPENRLSMDGASVFQWTRRELGKQIKDLIASSDYSLDQVEKFYLHQASQLVITNVLKSLSVDKSKAPTTLHITGNLVSSSIPFLLENDFNEFINSKLIVMSGFGVGLSSSSCLLKRADT